MKVLVLYHSRTGHTQEAAKATAAGIRSAGSEADIVAVTDFDASSIAESVWKGPSVCPQDEERFKVWGAQFVA